MTSILEHDGVRQQSAAAINGDHHRYGEEAEV